MSRKGSNLQDYGIEEEIDPKLKFNSLISVTVSTIMCLATKCPLPKSNVETTKLFLRTITDDSGKTPRNIKGFLTLLNEYSGPYDTDSRRESLFEKPPAERPMPEKEKLKEVEEKNFVENMELAKTSTSAVLGKETPTLESPIKRTTKMIPKRIDRDQKRTIRHSNSKISASKSVISSKT